MSSQSTENQVPPPMEEYSNTDHHDKQGRGEEDIPSIKLKVETIEELEECKTPTWSRNKIPVVKNCPFAPRKKRRSVPQFSSRMMKRSLASEFKYVNVVKHEEVESFFQSVFQLTRVNKRCTTTI